jgi:hypothetical protein
VRVSDCLQRSDEWRQLRCGKHTASRARDILGRADKKTLRTYRVQVIREQLTGIPEEQSFMSAAMRRGRDLESRALAAYAAHLGVDVRTCGFIAHDELAAGCSLDGYVGAFEGVVEVKVPNTATHFANLWRRAVPARYVPQITHQLWITAARWCDFVSYDDRWPLKPLHVIRVWRDQLDIAGYELATRRFLADVTRTVYAARQLEAFIESAPIDVAQLVLQRGQQHVDRRRRVGLQPTPHRHLVPPTLAFARGR